MNIKLSRDLSKELGKRKVFEEDSYEDIIWDLVEDKMELLEETKRTIKEYEENKMKFVHFKG